MDKKTCYNGGFSLSEEISSKKIPIKTTRSYEYTDIDESLVTLANETERNLFRVEMNVIEFPFFSKSPRNPINDIKTYYFSSDKTSYFEVIPSINNAIPGEFEEKIFYSLLKIFKDKGYQRSFYCTNNEILSNLTNVKSTLKAYSIKLKSSIKRLATSSFVFSNLFYDGVDKKNYDGLFQTVLFNYGIITPKTKNPSICVSVKVDISIFLNE